MTTHPYAELFPMMSDEELEKLADDIKKNGLREPIITLDGRILDGRNRYEACRRAAVKPTFEVFEWADPLAFVLSRNMNRRHLTESQRAMVASKLAKLKPGDNQHTKGGSANSPNLDVATQAEAAKTLNVGERIVRDAKKVQTEGIPELTKLVERGKISVNAAAEVAKLPPEQQAELVTEGAEAVKNAASEIRAKKKKLATEPVKQQKTDPEVKVTDEHHVEKPAEPVEDISWVKRMESWSREIDRVVAMIEADKQIDDRMSYTTPWQQIIGELKSARSSIWASRPDFECPYCDKTGQYKGRECSGCKGRGMVPKHVYTSGRSAMNK